MVGLDLTNRVVMEIHPVEGRYTSAQKLAFMRKATDAVVRILGCSPEEVVVRIHEQKPENVSRGGFPFTPRG